MAKEIAPRREAGFLEHVLLGVAGQRQAAIAIETVEQDAHFEGREILHFVDGNMAQAQWTSLPRGDGTYQQLPGAQQQRVVGGRQRCFGAGLAGALPPLLAPGAWVIADQPLETPALAPLPPPEGVAPERYFLYRNV
jgi:hypothetical protein